jgi:urea carboxylase
MAFDPAARQAAAPVVHQTDLIGNTLRQELQPPMTHDWHLRVIYGPHGAPDFFTEADIDSLFATAWEVHYNSSRTGVRLTGPKPEWARPDGGEAGLHPSNIHDNAYAFGSVDFTGDMPVILGPDGPSLGGFVCPCVVIQADLWKLGQLRAGDTVTFVPVTQEVAVEQLDAQRRSIESLTCKDAPWQPSMRRSPVLFQFSVADVGVQVTYRTAGDQFLLVEYGENQLDVRLRFRVHALMQWLQEHPVAGMLELTPGIRSLQVHYDTQQLSQASLLTVLTDAEHQVSQRLSGMSVPSRIVHLPLSWNDEVCQQAVDKYLQSVRQDAPWCPSNLEFIRRINGLSSIDAVKQIVFAARYLVMGLGDVYLGAPVATPVNPKHRLVTTKYNPARTWTAENSVGIGGSYLCVYGMEGPGGYQFIGRTLQMWNRWRETADFTKPWLLRFFDQICFHEVSHDELTQIRRDFPLGRYSPRVEHTEFSLVDYDAMLHQDAASIAAFQRLRSAAFAGELARWHRSGQFTFEVVESSAPPVAQPFSQNSTLVDSPVSGSIWQALVAAGDAVVQGDTLLILESMKMEIAVVAPRNGIVTDVLSDAGDRVQAGQVIVVMQES